MGLKTLAGLLAAYGVLGSNCMAGMQTGIAEPEYAQAGHAVIVVDMQQNFLGVVSRQELAEELPYQIEVIQAAQRNNLPVFVLEFEGAGSTIPSLMNVIDDEEYEVITKSFLDGFRGTNLDSLLREYGAHSVILAGVYASDCVQATADGALQNGYSIITSPEVIEDLRGYDTDASDAWYRHNGTWFESHDELVDYIDNL